MVYIQIQAQETVFEICCILYDNTPILLAESKKGKQFCRNSGSWTDVMKPLVSVADFVCLFDGTGIISCR